MLNRRWAHCKVPTQRLAGVGFGICVGIFLGICFSFESRTDVEQRFIAQQQFGTPTAEKNQTAKEIWIRCVILIQPSDPRPHKYVRSILDTYAKRCNKTVFFTKEEKLLPRFHDEAEIYALNNFHEPTSYSFFHLITQLVYSHAQKAPTPRPETEWTIFLNEQNFLIPENLQPLLQDFDSTRSIVFGRLTHSKWILTYLFPFLQTETFQVDAGILMSRGALKQIATAGECQPHWFLPAHTGKGLFACGKKLNIQMIDPIDEEGYRLFMPDNLRNLFSLSQFSSKEKSFEKCNMKLSLLTIGLLLVWVVDALPRGGNRFYKSTPRYADSSPYKWSEEWFEYMPIDHFSYADHRTFELRYFINLDHYTPGGPIFFYTGNEGNLEAFALNTGFMWDIAPEYKAALVFVEHRFYGKSLPFGNQSFTDIKNLGYLSSEQALADFAVVIPYLKNERIPSATHSPVIAFGGSYGGMLTTWLRIKYPHLVDGGIAASAPVFWFRNAGVAQDAYAHIVSRTFKLSGCSLKALMSSFSAVHEVAKTEEGIEYINNILHLNEDSKVLNSADSVYLVQAATDIMENVAMVDYPYEANFLQKLPAWPVKEMCKAFASKNQRDVREQVKSLHSIFNVWYNTSGDVKEFCLRGKCAGDDNLGAMEGWTWQTCTEMVMPICHSGPPNDVFRKDCPFTIEGYLDFCSHAYRDINYDHELMRPDWILDNYGREFPTATNIVFSNGYLDPWSAGGWSLEPKTEGTLVSLIIEDGAHHYDLRGAHPNDTKYVIEARRIEKLHISRWIQEAKDKPRLQFKKVNIVNGYPARHRHHSGHRHRRY